jgi:hypothetical protein
MKLMRIWLGKRGIVLFALDSRLHARNAPATEMRLSQPLLQLPISLCPDVLAAEVKALPASAWVPHPTGFAGNEAVRLVTPGGRPTDDLEGPMRPTEQLLSCPYIMQVMAELGGIWGRSRLMSLAPGAEVPEHVDAHYYWRTHLRIHIPVITNSGVTFTCGGETVHMSPGECWVFDSFRWHEVHNRGAERRVHLVLDTVPTERLWDLVDAAQTGAAEQRHKLLPGERSIESLAFERVNAPKVMSPWEIRCHIAFIGEHAVSDPLLAPVMKRLDRFADAWAALWARFGDADEGADAYRQLLASIQQELVGLGGGHLALDNQLKLYFVLDQLIFLNAITTPAAPAPAADQRLAS